MIKSLNYTLQSGQNKYSNKISHVLGIEKAAKTKALKNLIPNWINAGEKKHKKVRIT